MCTGEMHKGAVPKMLKIKNIWKGPQSMTRRKIHWHEHSVNIPFKMNKHVLHIKTWARRGKHNVQ